MKKNVGGYLIAGIFIFSLILSTGFTGAIIPGVKDNLGDYLDGIEDLEKEIVEDQAEIDELRKKITDGTGLTGDDQERIAELQKNIEENQDQIEEYQRTIDTKYSDELEESQRDPITGLRIIEGEPAWFTNLKDVQKNPVIGPIIQGWERGEIQKSTLKIFLLILITVLLFSTFSFVDFPSGFILKSVLSIFLGFFITFFITPDEILGALLGYKALGVSLMIFFPILILAFFSFMVAFRMSNPFTLLAQRLLWLIYGLFLIFRVISISLGLVGLSGGGGFIVQYFGFIWNFLAGGFANTTSGSLITLLIIHLIVGITVIWIFVIKNQEFIRFVYDEKLKAEVAAGKAEAKKAKAGVEIAGSYVDGGK